MHADRTNRIALILLGVLLLAGGVGGVLAGFGVVSSAITTKALFDNAISRYIGQHGSWLWPVVAIGCVVLLAGALRWLLALLVSTDRAGNLVIAGERTHGVTDLRDGALTAAVTTEIETFRGVAGTKARLLGDPGDPTLVIVVTALRDADLAALHRRIESEACGHVRQALDRPDMPIQLDLKVSSQSASRMG